MGQLTGGAFRRQQRSRDSGLRQNWGKKNATRLAAEETPKEEMVDKYHAIYCEKLQELFAQHKERFQGWDRVLHSVLFLGILGLEFGISQ